MEQPYDPMVPPLGTVYPKKPQTTNSKEHMHPYVIAASFTRANIWEQPKFPSVNKRIKKLWDL